ncbi:MAG: LEVG family PEP-CTERM protein [Cyanobacteria bacterium P01_D01_bin.50]
MKNFKKLVKTLAVSTIGLGIATGTISEAQAASLAPTQEGEIKIDNIGGCLNPLDPTQCIDTTTLPFAYEVTSLGYDNNFDPSRLFADRRDTDNDYGFGIQFIGDDEGTNTESGIWFRPVAIQGGVPVEGDGGLEVGQFKFDFLGKIANEVRLDFFDVEDSGFSGILKVNGADVDPEDFLLDGGEDGNTQTLRLENVSSFVVQLGNVNSSQFPTGDGVNLAVSVPESETSIALSLVAVAGVLTLKRRKKASQKV